MSAFMGLDGPAIACVVADQIGDVDRFALRHRATRGAALDGHEYDSEASVIAGHRLPSAPFLKQRALRIGNIHRHRSLIATGRHITPRSTVRRFRRNGNADHTPHGERGDDQDGCEFQGVFHVMTLFWTGCHV